MHWVMVPMPTATRRPPSSGSPRKAEVAHDEDYSDRDAGRPVLDLPQPVGTKAMKLQSDNVACSTPPQRRGRRPFTEEVADAIAYPAAPASGPITCTSLAVDVRMQELRLRPRES